MTGVKDKHDMFMDSYFEKLKNEAMQKAKDAEDRIKKARESHDNVFIEGSSRALTPEETRELLSRKKTNVEKVLSEENADPETKNNFLQKVGSRVLKGE